MRTSTKRRAVKSRAPRKAQGRVRRTPRPHRVKGNRVVRTGEDAKKKELNYLLMYAMTQDYTPEEPDYS